MNTTWKKTYVITCWYYNPIHPWHIECFELSKALWDELRVMVNNDHQAQLKRWKPSFQNEEFRMNIVWALWSVDKVVLGVDQDLSMCESLRKTIALIREESPDCNIIFAKWWDRFVDNIPEVEVCKELWVTIVDWLWEKTHSSRDYVVLDED